MKTLTILLICAFALGGVRNEAPYRYEWERHECTICGKTIWEKVVGSTGYDGTDNIVFWDDGLSTITFGAANQPVKVEAEHLVYRASYRVCPYCEGKYVRKFREAAQKAVDAFIAEAKGKEAERRKIVSQENTQEDLRIMQEKVDKASAELRSLIEKLDAMKE